MKMKSALTPTVRKRLDELTPHPRNEEIYGVNEEVSTLVEKIRKSGVVTTLIITDDNVIISGNRRWKSCKQLAAEGDKRFCSVDCEVKSFDSEEDELEYLVICNDTREKTREQKAREAQMLLEVEKVRAEKRMLAGTKSTPVAVPPQGQEQTIGKSRDIVAKKLHMRSGREVERAVKTINKIDELQEQGRSEDSQLIKNTLNNTSASTAEELAKHIDEMSETDKQAIRDKKISAYKALTKYTTKRSEKPTDDISEEEKEQLAHKQACKEAVEEYIAQSLGLIEIPNEPIENRGGEILSIFEMAVDTLSTSVGNMKTVAHILTEEQRNKANGIIMLIENKLNNLKELINE